VVLAMTVVTAKTDLIARLHAELSQSKSNKIAQGPVYVRPDNKSMLVFDCRKYHDQAHNYQYAVILALEGKPIPDFIINLSDISQELKAELNSLSAAQLRQTLWAAVLRIYQDIDVGHNALFEEISKILKVRLVK
jgi:hypothetical protein